MFWGRTYVRMLRVRVDHCDPSSLCVQALQDAHLRPAVARVCWAVQLQSNEVVVERRRSEDDSCSLVLQVQHACGEERGPSTSLPANVSLCNASPTPPHSEWGCGTQPWTSGDR